MHSLGYHSRPVLAQPRRHAQLGKGGLCTSRTASPQQQQHQRSSSAQALKQAEPQPSNETHSLLKNGSNGRNGSVGPASAAPAHHQQQQEQQQQLPGGAPPEALQPPPPAPPSPRAASPIEELLLKTLDAEDASGSGGGGGGGAGSTAAALGVAAGLVLLLGGGYAFRDPIKHFLNFFIDAVDEWGSWGYVAYALVYTGLEVLAVPAIPLTATAGVIFGPLVGTAIVSASSTTAAAIAFLIARYVARDKVLQYAKRHPRFAAIDRAISKDGLKFVTLVRLSPLLPLALSNYIYGLTSVDLGSYVLGSWIGMLPGTYAFVSAGHVGKAMLLEGSNAAADAAAGGAALSFEPWQLALGLGTSVLAIGYIGRLATKAIEEADSEALAAQQLEDAEAVVADFKRQQEEQQRQEQQQQQKAGE